MRSDIRRTDKDVSDADLAGVLSEQVEMRRRKRREHLKAWHPASPVMKMYLGKKIGFANNGRIANSNWQWPRLERMGTQIDHAGFLTAREKNVADAATFFDSDIPGQPSLLRNTNPWPSIIDLRRLLIGVQACP
jgi:hypothetical protein